MSVIAEAEIMAALKANLEAAEAALARNDWVALRALAEQEARYMDELRAVWSLMRPKPDSSKPPPVDGADHGDL